MIRAEYLFYFVSVSFGFIHGILFAVILVIRGMREDRKSDLILAAVIVCGCLLILPVLLGMLDIHLLWNKWLFLPIDPGLLIGPLLYFFLKAQTNRYFAFGKRDLLHFLPYACYAIYHLIVFSQGREFVFEWMDTVDLPLINPLYQVATLIIMCMYLIASIRYYVGYRRWIESEYASPEHLRYTWITRFLWAITIVIIATSLIRFSDMLQTNQDYTQNWWTAIIVTVSMYFVSLSGLLSMRAPRYTASSDKKSSSQEEGGTTNYSAEELDAWLSRLIELMEDHNMYQDPDLSLGMVSEQLGLTRKQISAAINERYGANFRRFVNTYRVSAFKKCIQKGQHEGLTLFGLAMDCGFNSKATFNRVFKQIEGKAPNDYVRSIQQEVPESVSLPSLS